MGTMPQGRVRNVSPFCLGRIRSRSLGTKAFVEDFSGSINVDDGDSGGRGHRKTRLTSPKNTWPLTTLCRVCKGSSDIEWTMLRAIMGLYVIFALCLKTSDSNVYDIEERGISSVNCGMRELIDSATRTNTRILSLVPGNLAHQWQPTRGSKNGSNCHSGTDRGGTSSGRSVYCDRWLVPCDWTPPSMSARSLARPTSLRGE